MDEPNPDDQPTVEANAATPPAEAPIPGMKPDELRAQAQQLKDEAGERARAAAELRDAAAALRAEAATLLERVPELAAEAAPAREDSPAPPAEVDPPAGEPPAAERKPRRRWFRSQG